VKITHFGHACVLVEVPGDRRSTRVLIDPGTYSHGFEHLTDLDAILVTHQHPDHLDVDRLGTVLAANPGSMVGANDGSAAQLNKAGIDHQSLADGDEVAIGDTQVRVIGSEHATVHLRLPSVPNNAYLFRDGLLHPGDAFVPVEEPVRVLLLPTGGPWMKAGEGVDYLCAVAPELAIPIHQAGLTEAHQNMHYGLFRSLGPTGSTIEVLDRGKEFSV
jgi:L-ascorbate metabolism protein UlaG (beta-lactamase superfamily)